MKQTFQVICFIQLRLFLSVKNKAKKFQFIFLLCDMQFSDIKGGQNNR